MELSDARGVGMADCVDDDLLRLSVGERWLLGSGDTHGNDVASKLLTGPSVRQLVCQQPHGCD